MLKSDNFPKEFVFLVQFLQELLIFSCSKTETYIGEHTQANLLADVLDNEIPYRLRKFFAFIVVIIYLPAIGSDGRKTKRANGIDVEITVKSFFTAKCFDHFIHKS